MSAEKVSILIPCYNAERWIAEAIESGLQQTWADFEVIVVDDGSVDGSLSVIEKFGDRIRWESGPNRGGNVARNRLLELASGRWVQYLDADDYLLPGKVAAQMEYVASHPGVDVVIGPVTLEHWTETDSQREVLDIPEPHDPWILLARWYLPQTGAALWRREAIQDVGGWKADQPCCQEHELYLRMLQAGKRIQLCPHTGAVYRQWSQQTVCNRDLPEVHRRRLAIEDAAEAFLRDRGELEPDRQRAINQARFEIARMVWQYAPARAREIIGTIHRADPHFLPSGAAAPTQYRFVYQLLGFRFAQQLADWRRSWIKN